VERAGFQVEYASCFFRFLPVPIFLFRSLPTRLGLISAPTSERTKKEHAPPSGMKKRLLDRLLEGEVRKIGRGEPMTFGSSCLLAAKA